MTCTNSDHSAILELLARYAWLVDEGDGDGYADLWTSDGKFTGIPTTMEGRDALRKMPPEFYAMAGGQLRHLFTNVVVDAGAAADEATAKCYSSVYDLRNGAKLWVFAKLTYTLVRLSGRWKIKALHADTMLGP
jgi:uncharacterized protein (TIGR02246 family)